MLALFWAFLYRSLAYLALEAWSVNSVATREKYLRILIHRLGLGMQPLCAWMAWMRAISVAMSLTRHIQMRLRLDVTFRK